MSQPLLSRRAFLRLAVGATAMTVLSACQPQSESPGQGSTSAPAEADTPQKATSPQKATIFFWDGPPLIGIREKALQPFNDTYKDCVLDFQSAPGGSTASYKDKLFTMLGAGTAPDAFIIDIAWLPQFLSKDLLLDVKPFMDKENYDLTEFPELAIDTYTYKGGIYGLPDNVCSYGTFFNVGMFEQAGISPPTAKWDDPSWTVDDFLTACEQLTKRDADGKVTQYAYAIPTWWKMWAIWVRVFGGSVVDDPLRPTQCTLDRPEAIEALQFLADLRYKHEYAPKPEAMAEIGANDLLLTGRLAMVDNGSWFFPQIRGADFEIDTGHFPKGKARANYVFYYPLCIPKTTKVPECAWNLLKYFNGPAIEEIIKAGGLQGTRLSAQREFFLADPEPPEHKEVFVDAVEHFVAPDPLLTNWAEIDSTMASIMDNLWIGKKDAEQCVTEVKAAIDPLIKQGQWRED